jgi:hypothetical protein
MQAVYYQRRSVFNLFLNTKHMTLAQPTRMTNKHNGACVKAQTKRHISAPEIPPFLLANLYFVYRVSERVLQDRICTE